MLQLGPVYLNVHDLPRLSQFYQEVVGLSVLSKTKAQIVLGIQADQKPLVILQQAAKNSRTLSFGNFGTDTACTL